MAILDDALAGVVDALTNNLATAGLTRTRGGLVRGIAWAEASGRVNGDWYELRLHHRPVERRLQAGLLAYQSLSKGGRTLVVGEDSLTYAEQPEERMTEIVDAITGWLRTLDDPDAEPVREVAGVLQSPSTGDGVRP
jgi:hypothetical protein